MTSVDWAGQYSGVVPCADCPGIETTIVLASDRTFLRTMRYVGRDDRVLEQRGTFEWMPDGGRIQLHGITDGPSQYRVGENQIIQLDLQGNRITGALADRYVLRKVPDTTAAVPSGQAAYVASRAAAVSADTPLM